MASSARKLRIARFMIDGEAVACDADGIADFERAPFSEHDDGAFLYGFDLLSVDGADLREGDPMTGAPSLRQLLPKPDGIRFSEEGQQKLRNELERAQKRDGLVDPLLFTQFADKKSILRKSGHRKSSRERFDDELGRIQSLRDHLAHANDYAASPEAASKTCETVRLLDTWREEFLRWLHKRA